MKRAAHIPDPRRDPWKRAFSEEQNPSPTEEDDERSAASVPEDSIRVLHPARRTLLRRASLIALISAALIIWGARLLPHGSETQMRAVRSPAEHSASSSGGSKGKPDSAGERPAGQVPAGDPMASASSSETRSSGDVIVDVVGAVARPGVYTLKRGARVSEALEKAGGALPGADVARINRAAAVADGQQIFVPMPGEAMPAAPSGNGSAQQAAPGAAGSQGGAAPLDINTADSSALETLPGIGPVTAANIVRERTENGPFSSVEDLTRVTGIGEATVEKLREHVTVGSR